MAWLRWQDGRQGTGYRKLLLLGGPRFDVYLLHFPCGSYIHPHTDPVAEGRHFRANLTLWRARRGGEFVCSRILFEVPRLKVFRPDIMEHSVTQIEEGTRWVLSLGARVV
jgi:hypothetical protein